MIAKKGKNIHNFEKGDTIIMVNDPNIDYNEEVEEWQKEVFGSEKIEEPLMLEPVKLHGVTSRLIYLKAFDIERNEERITRREYSKYCEGWDYFKTNINENGQDKENGDITL